MKTKLDLVREAMLTSLNGLAEFADFVEDQGHDVSAVLKSLGALEDATEALCEQVEAVEGLVDAIDECWTEDRTGNVIMYESDTLDMIWPDFWTRPVQ